MKSLIAGVLAMATLAGCVAVPYTYYDPYPSGYYYYGPPAPSTNLYFRYDYHRYRR